MFQAPYALVGLFDFLKSDEQTSVNNVRRLSGLKELSTP